MAAFAPAAQQARVGLADGVPGHRAELGVPGPPAVTSSPGAAVSAARAATAAAAAAAVARPRRRQRARGTPPVAVGASGSDQLLYESLNREIGKLSRGKRRPADVPAPLQSRPPASSYRGETVGSGGLGRFAEAARTSRVPVAARLLALACLLPPLVVALPYGAGLYGQLPWLRELLLRPMLPLVRAYYSSRLSPFIVIVALYGLVAKNRSLHPFTRVVGMQASTLMMMQFPLGFLLTLFAPMPGPMMNLALGVVFMYFLYCVALAAGSCLTGSPARLPLIGDGSLPSWRSGGWLRRPTFRGGG